MCGLVGIAGYMEYADEHKFQRMLMLDWFRGKDSTGVAGIRNNGDVKIAKVTSHPIDLFDMGRFKEAMSAHNSCAFIGHNRAATRGEINHTNAHPWRFGNIVGAHNGTIWPYCHKDLNKELGEDYPVDSMAIFAAIDVMGIEETLKMIDGAYALTYFNLADGTMNFIRNDERPLWWAKNQDGNKLYWASTWGMIKGGLAEDELATLARDDKHHCYFEFAEDIHYSFDLSEFKRKDGKVKPTCKKMEGRKRAPFAGSGSAAAGLHSPVSDPFMREVGADNVLRLPARSGTPSRTGLRGSSRSNGVTVPLLQKHGSEEDPYAGAISEEKFKDVAKYGCSNCSRDIEWGDDISYWDRDDTILCGLCSGTLEGRSRIYTMEPIAAEG
jgi:hypothetical protein